MKTISFPILALWSGLHCHALAASVTLQQPTATFSQTESGTFSVSKAINGTLADNLGWAISPQISEQTAVFETGEDIGFADGSLLTFTLTQAYVFPDRHTLGRFRFSVTTDNRSSFADGLGSAGDVTANWIPLNPITFMSANGATLSKLGDGSMLASGATPATDIYTVTAVTSLSGITGVRLEVLQDPSLPFRGPGRQPVNGNFVLSEFAMSIAPIPEPSTLALLAAGFLAMIARHRRRK